MQRHSWPRVFLLVLVVWAVLTLAYLATLPRDCLSGHVPVFSRDSGNVASWPRDQTRQAAALVRPDHVTTIISPADVCTTTWQGNVTAPHQHVLLLVIVTSAVTNFKVRKLTFGEEGILRGGWLAFSELRLLINTPST